MTTVPSSNKRDIHGEQLERQNQHTWSQSTQMCKVLYKLWQQGCSFYFRLQLHDASTWTHSGTEENADKNKILKKDNIKILENTFCFFKKGKISTFTKLEKKIERSWRAWVSLVWQQNWGIYFLLARCHTFVLVEVCNSTHIYSQPWNKLLCTGKQCVGVLWEKAGGWSKDSWNQWLMEKEKEKKNHITSLLQGQTVNRRNVLGLQLTESVSSHSCGWQQSSTLQLQMQDYIVYLCYVQMIIYCDLESYLWFIFHFSKWTQNFTMKQLGNIVSCSLLARMKSSFPLVLFKENIFNSIEWEG